MKKFKFFWKEFKGSRNNSNFFSGPATKRGAVGGKGRASKKK